MPEASAKRRLRRSAFLLALLIHALLLIAAITLESGVKPRQPVKKPDVVELWSVVTPLPLSSESKIESPAPAPATLKIDDTQRQSALKPSTPAPPSHSVSPLTDISKPALSAKDAPVAAAVQTPSLAQAGEKAQTATADHTDALKPDAGHSHVAVRDTQVGTSDAVRAQAPTPPSVAQAETAKHAVALAERAPLPATPPPTTTSTPMPPRTTAGPSDVRQPVHTAAPLEAVRAIQQDPSPGAALPMPKPAVLPQPVVTANLQIGSAVLPSVVPRSSQNVLRLREPPPTQGGLRADSGPESLQKFPSYSAFISAYIAANIQYREEISEAAETRVLVKVSPDGVILTRQILNPSKFKAWDDAVLKAVDRTGKIPPDADGKAPPDFVVIFRRLP